VRTVSNSELYFEQALHYQQNKPIVKVSNDPALQNKKKKQTKTEKITAGVNTTTENESEIDIKRETETCQILTFAINN
jgi:uncharacterized cupin superfamily protein